VIELGVRIELPTNNVHPGETFWVSGYLDNPDGPMSQIPVLFLLDVFGSYFFWPSWRQYAPPESTDIDFEIHDIQSGTTQIQVLPSFSWPDTGAGRIESLYFYGAMLNQQMNALLGGMAVVEWGYGPG
jgi:hypothetical protein